jgi:hypothetical protein
VYVLSQLKNHHHKYCLAGKHVVQNSHADPCTFSMMTEQSSIFTEASGNKVFSKGQVLDTEFKHMPLC